MLRSALGTYHRPPQVRSEQVLLARPDDPLGVLRVRRADPDVHPARMAVDSVPGVRVGVQELAVEVVRRRVRLNPGLMPEHPERQCGYGESHGERVHRLRPVPATVFLPNVRPVAAEPLRATSVTLFPADRVGLPEIPNPAG